MRSQILTALGVAIRMCSLVWLREQGWTFVGDIILGRYDRRLRGESIQGHNQRHWMSDVSGFDHLLS